MFASGMGSFVGESTSEDEGDPTAGMELTLLGASLRPYIFFTSTSEVMGHAWSGTASELTPALQVCLSMLCFFNIQLTVRREYSRLAL